MKQARRVNLGLLFLILISVLHYGCDEEPKIERRKLVKIYVETTIAQGKFSDFPEMLDSAKQDVYNKYSTTEEEYESIIQSIEPKSEFWDKFFDEAKTYLDSLKNAPKKTELLSQE